ncbi:MAG: DUF1540 domain-containing protein [Archaeoglobus sp.]|nr:DUF1540 domain-containing protein [Archaeoglobus sp.]MBO8179858.1 DUF1540 domain-containing protein [Archaeoglobus sp.]
MPAVECNNVDCRYNDRGFCEAEIIEIRARRCVTPEVDEELLEEEADA